MFKSKKMNLPARPEPPSWEGMEEDLRVADKHDAIFTLTPELTDSNETSENSEDAKTSDMNTGDLFKHAVEFVEKNDELEQNMRLLDEELKKLNDISRELEATVVNVRQQALVAIDGR